MISEFLDIGDSSSSALVHSVKDFAAPTFTIANLFLTKLPARLSITLCVIICSSKLNLFKSMPCFCVLKEQINFSFHKPNIRLFQSFATLNDQQKSIDLIGCIRENGPIPTSQIPLLYFCVARISPMCSLELHRCSNANCV